MTAVLLDTNLDSKARARRTTQAAARHKVLVEKTRAELETEIEAIKEGKTLH